MAKREPFKALGDGVFKGKGVSSLLKSKDDRNAIIALFQGRENLPSSVMRAERPRKIKKEEDAAAHERSYDRTCKLAQMNGTTEGHGKSLLKSAYYISGRGCGAGALSTFPQNIGRSMVLLYSEPGEIIFDPFCVTPDTDVITSEGVKNIEKVVSDRDCVLTHKGRYRKVTSSMSRDVDEEIVCLKVSGAPTLRITKNHPVLAIRTSRCSYSGRLALPSCSTCRRLNGASRVNKGEKNYRGLGTRKCLGPWKEYGPCWVDAGELRKDDYVLFPAEGDQEDKIVISLDPYAIRERDKGRFLYVTDELLWLLGAFVAEGHVGGKHNVCWTVGKHERDFATKIARAAESCFGMVCRVVDREDENATDVKGGKSIIARFLLGSFSKLAHNKKLPQWLMELPPDRQQHFIRGYIEGDGCVFSGKAGEGVTVVSTSLSLAGQLKLLLARQGVASSVHRPKMVLNGPPCTWGIVHKNQAYQVTVTGSGVPKLNEIIEGDLNKKKHYSQSSFRIGGYIAYRVISAKTENYQGKVYNLSVLEDESYVTLQGAVHNCGHNSRMDLCVKAGRHYVGCDLSAEFMKHNRERAAQLREAYPDAKIRLIEGDSRKVPVKSDFAHMTITCYDDQTEVLTEKGWKFFRNLSQEDRIASLNQSTGELEYQDPEQIQSAPYSGKMYRLSTPFVDLNVTPNHNMYVRRRHKDQYELIQAKDLPPKAEFWVKGDAIWNGARKEAFVLSAVPQEGTRRVFSEVRTKKYKDHSIKMEVFLEFLGYWLSEGSLGSKKEKYPGSFSLTTASEDHLSKFQSAVRAMGLGEPRTYKQTNDQGQVVYRVVASDRRLYKYLEQFGKAADKYIPRELLSLSRDQLLVLFDALMVGDGSVSGRKYWTVSTRLRDDMMELALKLGFAASYSCKPINQRRRFLNGREIKSNYTCWCIHIKRTRTRTQVSTNGWKEGTKCIRDWVDYTGNVYCVSVPNRVIYVRRGGKAVWCGNSPPYWDIEYYGDEPEQLGLARTYDDFLTEMQPVMNENFRVLKEGAYAIWFINDFRRKGKFYAYHMDIRDLGVKAGFELADILISDLGNGIRDCFVNQTIAQRILPKRHEYGVVLRKPSTSEENSGEEEIVE